MRTRRSRWLLRVLWVPALAVVPWACGDDRVAGQAPDGPPPPGPAESALAAHVDDERENGAADEGGHNVSGMPLPVSFGRVWESWKGDFDAMVERRIIRAVVPYGGYQFYYDNGKPRGAAWELLQRFEQYVNEEAGLGHVGVHVIVIPLGRDQLIPAVVEGHADLIAGDLTVTDQRADALVFARPIIENVSEIVVTGPAAPELTGLDDLAGQHLVVRASSSYFEHLGVLSRDFQRRGLAPPIVVPADELLEAEDLLEMVNNGMVPMTVMDDYKAEFWSTVFPAIRLRHDLAISGNGSIAWALRPDSPGFAAVLDDFLARYGRGTMVGNDTFNRYLDDAANVRCSHGPEALAQLESLIGSFRQYGDTYGFDWLMLAAQGFQESGLRQDRRSSAGALGVMQIKPSTAADPNVGIDDITTADANIHAGAKYLRFLADRYFPSPEFDDLSQWLFALAAYNAGPARVARLQSEAASSGYDPNRWFNNVEIVAARRIGAETVTYVSNVFKYYVGYQLTADRTVQRTARYADELTGCRATPG